MAPPLKNDWRKVRFGEIVENVAVRGLDAGGAYQDQAAK